ncbi:hypothetical protein M427DRAFT_132162 [Gonapodya prolifera JEL478]|uniref:DnaJ homolog 1, mitochondrial n=1 Tax=Gonapodya prolifera (strain JEL478) TaxID=1344416 RepID=A0A139AQT1_GONPJ|nr:hypothetical protein M427DRAFT_132162 [Gonapodya prolifera JEL478]|eukprot:KXS19117.1 hypothetical protein M427DRAFT_132162 [Gonapodya prolifera JEL478]
MTALTKDEQVETGRTKTGVEVLRLLIEDFHSPPTRAPKRDAYEILGVQRNAAASDIKKAYYALAKQYHPDTNKDEGAHEKFVEIQEAYEILSDEQKRAAYDQFGHSAFSGPGGDPSGGGFGGGFPGGFPGGGFPGGQQFTSDLFEQLFRGFGMGGAAGGRGGGMGMDMAGEDINAALRIGFMDAIKGVQRPLTFQSIIKCSTCSGSGLKTGQKLKACEGCGGTGRKVFVRGGFQMVSECPTCQGAGTIIPKDSRCTSCEGHGRVRDKRTVMVSIPAGIDDGMKVRLAGQGDAPLQGNGSPGDLYVSITVSPHPTFRREGNDIHLDVPLPFTTAILGGSIRIPTVDGDVELKVEPGTQPEARKRLTKRGAPIVGRSAMGDRGDQWVTLKVQVPKRLTSRQQELLKEWIAEDERALGDSGAPDDKSKGRATASGSSSASSGRTFSTSAPSGTTKTSTKKPSSDKQPKTNNDNGGNESATEEKEGPSGKHGFFQSASEWLRGKEKKDA